VRDALRRAATSKTVFTVASTAYTVALAYGTVAGTALRPTGEGLVQVSRWGRSGLSNGDWVMTGGRSFRNYMFSGKWQPGRHFAGYGTGATHLVNPAHLRGVGSWIKTLIGQRRYWGP
jgi:hypothetical protein